MLRKKKIKIKRLKRKLLVEFFTPSDRIFYNSRNSQFNVRETYYSPEDTFQKNKVEMKIFETTIKNQLQNKNEKSESSSSINTPFLPVIVNDDNNNFTENNSSKFYPLSPPQKYSSVSPPPENNNKNTYNSFNTEGVDRQFKLDNEMKNEKTPNKMENEDDHTIDNINKNNKFHSSPFEKFMIKNSFYLYCGFLETKKIVKENEEKLNLILSKLNDKDDHIIKEENNKLIDNYINSEIKEDEINVDMNEKKNEETQNHYILSVEEVKNENIYDISDYAPVDEHKEEDNNKTYISYKDNNNYEKNNEKTNKFLEENESNYVENIINDDITVDIITKEKGNTKTNEENKINNNNCYSNENDNKKNVSDDQKLNERSNMDDNNEINKSSFAIDNNNDIFYKDENFEKNENTETTDKKEKNNDFHSNENDNFSLKSEITEKRSEEPRLNSSHLLVSRMPSSA
jgi:hypothetical protein